MMITFRQHNRFIFAVTLISFIGTSVLSNISFAQSVLNLPEPGTQLHLTQAFNPPIIKGITIYPNNPLQFDFIINQGDKNLTPQELRQEGLKMVKYFMASMTIPNKEMWVNLSPLEKNRIIGEGLGHTTMGRDLLAEDYMLKQLSASMMDPNGAIGKKFWDKVYQEAKGKFGTTDVPVNTFNKVWIVPDRAVVLEHNQSAFVAERHLKVMLEEDYLLLVKHNAIASPSSGVIASEAKVLMSDTRSSSQSFSVHSLASKIIKEIVIPALEKEVNTGTTFANVRQVYNAMILATWYKQNLKETLLAKVYADKNKTRGVDINDKQFAERIYKQYLKAFKRGVVNFIREEPLMSSPNVSAGSSYPTLAIARDPEHATIARKYFSGGLVGVERVDRAQLSELTPKQRAFIEQGAGRDFAMMVNDVEVSPKERKTALVQATDAVLNNLEGVDSILDKAMRSSSMVDEFKKQNYLGILNSQVLKRYFVRDVEKDVLEQAIEAINELGNDQEPLIPETIKNIIESSAAFLVSDKRWRPSAVGIFAIIKAVAIEIGLRKLSGEFAKKQEDFINGRLSQFFQQWLESRINKEGRDGLLKLVAFGRKPFQETQFEISLQIPVKRSRVKQYFQSLLSVFKQYESVSDLSFKLRLLSGITDQISMIWVSLTSETLGDYIKRKGLEGKDASERLSSAEDAVSDLLDSSTDDIIFVAGLTPAAYDVDEKNALSIMMRFLRHGYQLVTVKSFKERLKKFVKETSDDPKAESILEYALTHYVQQLLQHTRVPIREEFSLWYSKTIMPLAADLIYDNISPSPGILLDKLMEWFNNHDLGEAVDNFTVDIPGMLEWLSGVREGETKANKRKSVIISIDRSKEILDSWFKLTEVRPTVEQKVQAQPDQMIPSSPDGLFSHDAAMTGEIKISQEIDETEDEINKLLGQNKGLSTKVVMVARDAWVILTKKNYANGDILTISIGSDGTPDTLDTPRKNFYIGKNIQQTYRIIETFKKKIKLSADEGKYKNARKKLNYHYALASQAWEDFDASIQKLREENVITKDIVVPAHLLKQAVRGRILQIIAAETNLPVDGQGGLVALYEKKVSIENLGITAPQWRDVLNEIQGQLKINLTSTMRKKLPVSVTLEELTDKLFKVSQAQSGSSHPDVAKMVHNVAVGKVIPMRKRADSAMAVNEERYGGINLNPELLNLQIKRDKNGIALPVSQQPIASMKIDGFIPIIIQIKPINIQTLLA